VALIYSLLYGKDIAYDEDGGGLTPEDYEKN